MNRRKILATLATIAATSRLSVVAHAAGPTTHLVFPFAPGGGGDALSRLIAEKIAAIMDRTVIVENRTGADGRLAIQHVKQAAPDGTTLLLTTGPTMWLYPLANPSVGYNPHTDFTPISQLASFEFCIAVANNTGVKTMPELAAFLKANPEKAVYGVPSKGTIPHFTGVALAKLLGVDLRVTAYRGGAPAILDLIGGHIPVVIGTLADAIQQHAAGTLRIVAMVSKTRSPTLPEMPTLMESGFAVSGDSWYGLWGPAKLPTDLVSKLNNAVAVAMSDPAIKQRLDAYGFIPSADTPEALTAIMASDTAIWGDIIKISGFKLE